MRKQQRFVCFNACYYSTSTTSLYIFLKLSHFIMWKFTCLTDARTERFLDIFFAPVNLMKNNNLYDCVTVEWKLKKRYNLFVRSFIHSYFFSFVWIYKILVSRETKISNQNVYFLFSPFFLFSAFLFLFLSLDHFAFTFLIHFFLS